MAKRKRKRKTKSKSPRRPPRLVPEKVVPRLVAKLNARSSFRGLAQALEAGEIVCNMLYGGEPRRLGPGRRRGPVFNRLAKDDGLPYSAPSLRRFLAVYELYRRLDGARLRHLGLSHYLAVLSFPRDLQKTALETASEQRWPATKLEATVKRWRQEGKSARS
jgi:hypothetical protein